MDIVNWVPFQHENLDYKQKILQIAKNRDNTKLEHILTATLIYVNAVDYIASHLLTNLRQITYYVLHTELNASIFYENKKNTGLSLGKTVGKLKSYEFPDKDTFLEELERFKYLRDRYVHNFLLIPPEELEKKFGIELTELYSLGESLLTRYDSIVRGILTTWDAYKKNKGFVLPPPVIEQDAKVVKKK